MRYAAVAACLVVLVSLLRADPGAVSQLREQVQASDALGAMLQQQIAEAQATLTALGQQPMAGTSPTPPTTRASRLSYDAALHVAVRYVRDGGANLADPWIQQLSQDQLRRELIVLHIHNLNLYLQLNRQLDQIAALQKGRSGTTSSPATTLSSESVMQRLREQGGATTRPTHRRPPNSIIAALHHPESAAPQYDAAHQIKSAADRAAEVEQPETAAMTPAQMAAAVMSGAPLPGSFGVPSVVAPLNARQPGSEPVNQIQPESFPLMSPAPGTTPLPATPAGTPAAVVPPPEMIQMLSNLLGVSPQQAETLFRQGGTLGQMRQAAGAAGGGGQGQTLGAGAGTLSASATPPSADDPRWRAFYYGPMVGENFWLQGQGDPFGFTPGGGKYNRYDPRVNQDFDVRVNGDMDRRVNVANDRRMNTRVDPRVNQ